MGIAESRPQDLKEEYIQRLEAEAVRAAMPRGLLDETSNKLKYELHYCLTKNDWWFTMGGIGIGGFLSWHYRMVQPLAFAAILCPGLDWFYSNSLCAEEQARFNSHREKVLSGYKQQAQEIRNSVRSQVERGELQRRR